MTLQFDHAIILVNDLQVAIKHYQALGFNAFFGGEHAGGKTHNALIVFMDGTYLELLAPTSPALLDTLDPTDHSSFLFLLAQGEGPGGYALLSTDLESDVAAMQKRGLAINLGASNGRARPDGKQLRWRTAVLEDGSMAPFIIQDETPRVLRVPNDTALTTQANGTKGVKGLTVGVADLAAGIRHYQMITGIKAQFTNTDTATLSLQGVNITIVLDKTLSNQTQLQDIQLRGKSDDVISIKSLL